MKQSVCLYFKVHQPFQLKAYTQSHVGIDHYYIDDATDEATINKISDECYLPANSIISSNIHKTKGRFKLSYSISGTTLELLLKYRPDVIDSFKGLVNTGSVEILAETYYNSLSFLHSKKEFENQIEKHSQLVQKIFAFDPKVFRNTELIYNNSLAQYIYKLGYKGILCEGIERILKARTANKIYAAPNTGELALLLRNSRLSDDVAFRFDDKTWNEHPLTADKFTDRIHSHPETDQVINLFMDYETFGIHKKRETGIFDFLNALPHAILTSENFQFSTASGAIEQYYPYDLYDVPLTISWEDKAEACCIWCENAKQNNTVKKIYSLEKFIRNSSNEQLIEDWRKLQTGDYIFYMAEHKGRKHLNFVTPEDAYEHYKNIVTDLEINLIKEQLKKNRLDFIPLTHNVY
ncbi:MAG TPA: glycoside hydrolase family 57 protein [Chitinophagaceae bacterium]|jgi:alpha-amylase|nr:glycoside hydrolase family 57 protein [Chitinophagaceae bacterium]